MDIYILHNEIVCVAKLFSPETGYQNFKLKLLLPSSELRPENYLL
jgi:hypothetical protein